MPESIDFEAEALTEPLACVVHGVLNMRTVNTRRRGRDRQAGRRLGC
ncbi:MAG: hypothetical protein R2851_07480 [Caldilineaceae bacterium]